MRTSLPIPTRKPKTMATAPTLTTETPMLKQLETRTASLAPTTFNAEDNTVEVVISTGADVQRAGFIERLPVEKADLRNIAGAPVLDAHNQGSTRAVLGVI